MERPDMLPFTTVVVTPAVDLKPLVERSEISTVAVGESVKNVWMQ
jgi:hypothetical protein